MRNYINALKGLFKKTDKEEEVLPSESYIQDEDLSCLVTLRIDVATGDFNVIVDHADTSPEAASVVGLVLYLLNSGKLSSFFVEAYDFWNEDCPEKVSFTNNIMEQWIASVKLYEGEKKDDLAIRASDVFSVKD
tara:strand:+ start:548 stop:949 length:402 start_codon:yes stop_codon:yes gene_type:complete